MRASSRGDCRPRTEAGGARRLSSPYGSRRSAATVVPVRKQAERGAVPVGAGCRRGRARRLRGGEEDFDRRLVARTGTALNVMGSSRGGGAGRRQHRAHPLVSRNPEAGRRRLIDRPAHQWMAEGELSCPAPARTRSYSWSRSSRSSASVGAMSAAAAATSTSNGSPATAAPSSSQRVAGGSAATSRRTAPTSVAVSSRRLCAARPSSRRNNGFPRASDRSLSPVRWSTSGGRSCLAAASGSGVSVSSEKPSTCRAASSRRSAASEGRAQRSIACGKFGGRRSTCSKSSRDPSSAQWRWSRQSSNGRSRASNSSRLRTPR
jgi:hypothetical protein